MNERERFESSYTVDPDSGCWLWSRSLDTYGAGRMRYEGRLMQAHRVSLLLAGVELDPKREISRVVRPAALREPRASSSGEGGPTTRRGR